MAARKKTGGLGKGLDALISPSRTASKAENASRSASGNTHSQAADQVSDEKVKIVEKIVTVPDPKGILTVRIDEVEPNTDQPRKNFDDDALGELADSIRLHGVIQPLVVVKEDNYYRIIAGERRWRAARLAGLSEIPVIVKDYSAAEAIEVALIENIQREDLNPIEEADAYQRLIDEYGLKQEEVAEKVSKSRTTITNSLRLRKLDPRVRQMLADSMISSGHGRALLAIEDGDRQYQIAMQVFDNKLSVRQTESIIRNLTKTRKPARTLDPQREAVYRSLEDRMKSIFGNKVSIQAKNNKKGKIEIEYYSEDDLERIISMIESVNR